MEPIARTIYLSGLLDTYGLFLTERQRLVLSRHLDEDLSLQEIAEQEGISRQGVHDAIRRGEQQLLSFEAGLHLYQLRRDTLRALGKLRPYRERLPEAGAAALKALDELWEDEHGL